MNTIFAQRRARLLAMKALRDSYIPAEQAARCPACGATRMALALLQGDVCTAFRHNPLLFLLSPALLTVAAAVQFRYVSRGEVRLSPGLRRLMTTLYALFLLFGALRNLPGAPFQ